jgi:adhesin/invasin
MTRSTSVETLVRPMAQAIRHGATICAALLLAACSGDGPTTPDNPGPLVFVLAPGFVDGQSVVVGTPYPQLLGVQVTGVSPVNGQILNFVVTSGGGSVFAPVVATAKPTSGPWKGVNGIGENVWTLGPLAGPQTIEARLINPVTGATMTQATFHATGLAGPAQLIKPSAGDQQGALAGASVAVSPAVLVTDQFGNPKAGIAVSFAVATGGGSITGASQTTGANGVATVGSWTLGPAVGSNTLRATAAGLTGSPVTFTAVGGIGTATQLVMQAGDGQSATVGTAVAIPPTVRALDARGNGVPGVAVTFAVPFGDDSRVEGVTSITTLTDASGSAHVSWTMGTYAAARVLSVIAPGLSGSPVSFGATATAGPPTQFYSWYGDGQSAAAGTAVPQAPAMLVTDRYGNPVANVGVTFTVASGGGSVIGASQQTDVNGAAIVGGWILGTLPGTNTLTATVIGGPLSGNSVTITASAVAGPPAQVVIAAGDGQTGTIASFVPIVPAVTVTDQYSNPVPNATVTFAVATGGGYFLYWGWGTVYNVATDGNGRAVLSLGWILGTVAGSNTLTATVSGSGISGNPVTFVATALPGPATYISANAGDSQAAQSGTALPIPPSVLVTDSFGNPVPGVPVFFRVRLGGGAVTGGDQISDAAGIATVGSWTLGPVPIINELDAWLYDVGRGETIFQAFGQ